jgi:hypothetical protein
MEHLFGQNKKTSLNNLNKHKNPIFYPYKILFETVVWPKRKDKFANFKKAQKSYFLPTWNHFKNKHF